MVYGKLKASTYQRVAGTVFTGMGLVSLLFPTSVLRLSLQPSVLSSLLNVSSKGSVTINPAAKLLFQCFGAQASLCGVLMLTCHFTKQTFKWFGVSILPFFAFNYIYWQNGMLTTFGAIGDALGNVVFCGCCYMGYYS
jgi:hypothetical protein